MPLRAWVYVITNKTMPGLHKIGFSTKDPVLRAEELSHTGSPHPYTVVYDALVENARDIEQAVHRLLTKEFINSQTSCEGIPNIGFAEEGTHEIRCFL